MAGANCTCSITRASHPWTVGTQVWGGDAQTEFCYCLLWDTLAHLKSWHFFPHEILSLDLFLLCWDPKKSQNYPLLFLSHTNCSPWLISPELLHLLSPASWPSQVPLIQLPLLSSAPLLYPTHPKYFRSNTLKTKLTKSWWLSLRNPPHIRSPVFFLSFTLFRSLLLLLVQITVNTCLRLPALCAMVRFLGLVVSLLSSKPVALSHITNWIQISQPGSLFYRQACMWYCSYL